MLPLVREVAVLPRNLARAVALAAVLLAAQGKSPVQAEELWGLSAGNYLVQLSSSDPLVCESRPIIGVADGETIVAIDFRPEPLGMRLYALADTGQLYLIADPMNREAIPVGSSPGFTPKGERFGIDFDHLEGYLRVMSDAEQNVRIDPDSGALIVSDGHLVFAQGDPNVGQDPRIAACAYATGKASSRLYAIDAFLGVLVSVEDPSAGVVITVGSLGMGGRWDGFDISEATGTAYAIFAGILINPELYTINLDTAEAAYLSHIACEGALHGLSVANVTSPVRQSTWGQIKERFKE